MEDDNGEYWDENKRKWIKMVLEAKEATFKSAPKKLKAFVADKAIFCVYDIFQMAIDGDENRRGRRRRLATERAHHGRARWLATGRARHGRTHWLATGRACRGRTHRLATGRACRGRTRRLATSF